MIGKVRSATNDGLVSRDRRRLSMSEANDRQETSGELTNEQLSTVSGGSSVNGSADVTLEVKVEDFQKLVKETRVK
jgi:hypothetical protein